MWGTASASRDGRYLTTTMDLSNMRAVSLKLSSKSRGTYACKSLVSPVWGGVSRIKVEHSQIDATCVCVCL